MREGEDPAIVICSRRSAESSAGRRSCDQCGAGHATGCPNRGGEDRPEAGFCDDCGQPLTVDAASAVSAVPAPSAPVAAEPPVAAADRYLVSTLVAVAS